MSDELNNPIYSQEEINAARDELKNMTPEDLLALRGDLNRALNNTTLPEAVSVCWTELYTAKGGKINLTCRGVSGRQALDELADAMRYARDAFGMTNLRPEAPVIESTEPQYVSVGGVSETPTPTNIKVDEISVTSITRERKRDGKGDFLRVKGGMYTRFGAPAYDQVYPQGFDITKLTYGIEVTPPVGMHNAKIQADVDQDGKLSHAKVIQFS